MDRGEWGGDSKERGYRNYYKGHMDKIKGEGGGIEHKGKGLMDMDSSVVIAGLRGV